MQEDPRDAEADSRFTDLASRWPITVVAETESTNADLLGLARAGEGEQVLLAEHQSRGRGRLDREWVAPSGTGLTFSVLLRPQLAPASWPLLPLVVGVGLAQGLEVGLKWPNDLVVDDRKLGGILVETTPTPGGQAAVVGIGINVKMSTDQLPTPQATSWQLAGRSGTREQVFHAALAGLAGALADWARAGDAAVLTSYRQLCTTLGRVVRAELPNGEAVLGEAVEVSSGGQLVILSRGEAIYLAVADIVHVRPVADAPNRKG